MTLPSSAGERDLDALLASMEPEHQPGDYAFVVLPEGRPVPEQALASFREPEGLSAIVPTGLAMAEGWSIRLHAAWILLRVHSSLEATGFTAAFAAALGAAGIPCNVVAAVHHDHVFVPRERVEAAMEALRSLQGQRAR